MRAEEQDDVIRLWWETCLDTYHFIPAEAGRTLEDARSYFTSAIAPRHDLWVALDSGALAGFLAIREDFIDRLYVRPDGQRRGVGAALLDQARALSPERLQLYTHVRNKKARAFYEKHRFLAVKFGESPPPECEPDVLYEWRPARDASA